MLRIGLTGGIGCGKSVVAAHFAALNIPYIDADDIARQLTLPGSAVLDKIEVAFGKEVRLSDGELDRAWLRRRVFSDPGARKSLEAILHPLIYDAFNDRLLTITDAPYVLLVVPLLLETRLFKNLVNRVLVVDCTEAQQHERVRQRSKLTHAEIDAIIATQLSRSERLALADDVIINAHDMDTLKAQVEAYHQCYLALASKTL